MVDDKKGVGDLKKQLLLVSFLILVSMSNSYALSEAYKIQTKQQAYDVAIHVSGFEQEMFPFDSLVDNDIILDTIFDDNIPFWVPEDSGTFIWVVTFDEFKYTPDAVDKKIYKVYLIAKTKQLMKITGQEDVSKEYFMDDFTKEYLIIDNKGCGEEWINFPDKLRCPLSLALDRAIVRPRTAKEFYAIYINQKDLNHESRAIWIIYCNDLPYNKNNRFTSPREKVYLDGGSGHTLTISTF